MKVKILMPGTRLFFVWVAVSAAFFTFSGRLASAQQKEVVWSADEKPIADQIHGLRGLADDGLVRTSFDWRSDWRDCRPRAISDTPRCRKWQPRWQKRCERALCRGLRRKIPKPMAKRLHAYQRIHTLSWPHWCAMSMWMLRLTIMMTDNFGRRWPSSRQTTASGSIRSLR